MPACSWSRSCHELRCQSKLIVLLRQTWRKLASGERLLSCGHHFRLVLFQSLLQRCQSLLSESGDKQVEYSHVEKALRACRYIRTGPSRNVKVKTFGCGWYSCFNVFSDCYFWKHSVSPNPFSAELPPWVEQAQIVYFRTLKSSSSSLFFKNKPHMLWYYESCCK